MNGECARHKLDSTLRLGRHALGGADKGRKGGALLKNGGAVRREF